MKINKTPTTFPEQRYKKVDIGFWGKDGKYKKDVQFVNIKELKEVK